MKKIQQLLKSDAKVDSTVFSRRSTYNRDVDSWTQLENIIRRGGSLIDLDGWKERLLSSYKENVDENVGDYLKPNTDEVDGLIGRENDSILEDDLLQHHFNKRLGEFGQKFSLTAIQYAIMERRADVVSFLLNLLSKNGLNQALRTIMQPVKKEEAISPTKRNLKLSTMINLGGAAAGFPFRTDTPDALQTGRPIDWEDTMEWNCLHFAVKYHIQSLEVVLNEMISRLDRAQIIEILDFRDSKGRCVLHLAAKQQEHPEAAKIIYDAYNMLDEDPQNLEDNDGISPLHFSLKFGNAQLVQMFLDLSNSSNSSSRDDSYQQSFFSLDDTINQNGGPTNGVTNNGYDVTDIGMTESSKSKAKKKRCGESLLQFCSTPDICRLMIQRGCKPDLNAFLAQSREDNSENLEIFLQDSLDICDNLVILDFSLAMEQDRDGNLRTDGESLFLHRLMNHAKLLQSPIAGMVSFRFHKIA